MAFQFKIITKKSEWTKHINKCDFFDFYHSFDYHMLSSKKNEKPVLLVYKDGGVMICLPLIIRKISNTNYYDATSVYGYPGPVSKSLTPDFDNARFINEVKNYLVNNNIISVFSRLNPYIKCQNQILENFGEIVNQGKVVNIDITKSIIKQKQIFQSRLKTHINKARRSCIVIKASSNIHLNDFKSIYYENMKRVNAKQYYYFNDDYFQRLIKATDFKSEILLAVDKKTGKTIAGCQFITTNGIVQYHLSGTKNKFLNLTPTKLLIDEMRIIASQRGDKFFNLGGGLGGRDDDSLFNFKSSFSKDFKEFNLWKLIINQKAYDELVIKRGVINNSNFFPLYRCLDDININ